MIAYPRLLEDAIADWDQKTNAQTQAQIRLACDHERLCIIARWLRVRDNPDDLVQRRVGREFARAVLSGDPKTMETLENIAYKIGLE